MAGDWIKMEVCTPEKAEVLAITAILGWEDADLTVGKLFRLWRWFDQHTTDGNAVGVTAALLDRVVGVTGFCGALTQVGWLTVCDGAISLPNFDRHNGNTAKKRALTAKRVANHKSNAKGNAKGNATTVTSALPREEKRREDTTSPLRSEVETPRERSATSQVPRPDDACDRESPQTGLIGSEKQKQDLVDTSVATDHKNAPQGLLSKGARPIVARPDDVPEQVWIDWVALRKSKKAPVTATAMEQARREAGKAEMSLADFLRIWCARGSQGLQADWIKPNERPQATRLQETFRERDQRMARERFEEAIGRRVTPSNVVNIAPAAAPFLEIAQ